jgi:hypothetical protein
MTDIRIINEVKSKPWFPTAVIIAVAVAIIVLMFIIFRGCGSKNEHKADKKQVDSIVNKESERETIYKQQIKFYAAAYDSIHRENEIRKEQINNQSVYIRTTENKLIGLINRGRGLKVVHDTPAELRNCDTLRTQAGVLIMRIDEQEYNAKQLQANYEQQVKYKDSLATVAMDARNSLKISFDTVAAKYNNLYIDYAKVVKQKNRGRTRERILAGAALGELIYILIPHK